MSLAPEPELEPLVLTVTRADALAYAQASGDMNPIHRDDAAARALGLPGVIIHGMWTMGAALRFVAERCPGRDLTAVACAFTAPVALPADRAARLVVSGSATASDQLKLEVHNEDGNVRVARLTVHLD